MRELRGYAVDLKNPKDVQRPRKTSPDLPDEEDEVNILENR